MLKASHKDWIDVKAWQWDGERNINSETSTQGDRESANAVIRNLRLSKYMDSASPKLFIEFCCGTGNVTTLLLNEAQRPDVTKDDITDVLDEIADSLVNGTFPLRKEIDNDYI